MTGILLINLGTPGQPTTRAVRRYLKEFLSDPHVIDIHPVARWLLLRLVILPFRSFKSAAAYQKIWTDRGSPLLVHTQDLAQQIQTRLGNDFAVEVGMRYGTPSLSDAFQRLKNRGIRHLKILPLYPQYAASSTGSSVRAVKDLTGIESVSLEIIPPFYNHPQFIQAWVAQGRPILERVRQDHVLFSFHGLPERHIRAVEGCLTEPDCCQKRIPPTCYRAQAFETARLIAQGLRLEPKDFTVSFQSRLRCTPWIRPFTDQTLKEMALQGKRRLVVFCPSFVADCLETLEEIGIRGKETFMSHGGQILELVPSLNADPSWVKCLVQMITTKQQPC